MRLYLFLLLTQINTVLICKGRWLPPYRTSTTKCNDAEISIHHHCLTSISHEPSSLLPAAPVPHPQQIDKHAGNVFFFHEPFHVFLGLQLTETTDSSQENTQASLRFPQTSRWLKKKKAKSWAKSKRGKSENNMPQNMLLPWKNCQELSPLHFF